VVDRPAAAPVGFDEGAGSGVALGAGVAAGAGAASAGAGSGAGTGSWAGAGAAQATATRNARTPAPRLADAKTFVTDCNSTSTPPGSMKNVVPSAEEVNGSLSLTVRKARSPRTRQTNT
jgi:hypothetical protein